MPIRLWRNFDFWLFGATALLIGFGIAMISSAISDSPGLQDLPGRQAIYAGVGLILMALIARLDYRPLQDWRDLFYIISLALLAVVLVIGKTAHGAQRWVDFQLFPLQPSEVAKLLLILTLAGFFSTRREQIKTFRVFVSSLVYVLPPMALILAEPSLSAALSLGVLWYAMAFIAGVRWRYLLGVVVVILLISPIAWANIADYQRERVLDFVRPQSADSGEFSNVDQALISIGSGGLFGKGFALGSQSQLRFLRVRWSDFIFAVIGEELGLAGILLLFTLFLAVIVRSYRDAELARDMFGQLLSAGVGTLILLQAVVNIGMNLGLLPATGIPLPFVSSGGSSLITFLMGEGLIQSVCLRRKKIEFQLASRVS
jgi:rod shape determining protein RodA